MCRHHVSRLGFSILVGRVSFLGDRVMCWIDTLSKLLGHLCMGAMMMGVQGRLSPQERTL